MSLKSFAKGISISRGAAMTEFVAVAVAVMVFAGILVVVFKNVGNLNSVASDTVARSLACEIAGQRSYRTFAGLVLPTSAAIAASTADEVLMSFTVNGVSNVNVAVLAAECRQTLPGTVVCVKIAEACRVAPCNAANSAQMLVALQAFAANHARVVDTADGTNPSRGAVFEIIAVPLDQTDTYNEQYSCIKFIPDSGLIERPVTGCGCGCP